jgi:hypothetical protein
MEAEPYPLVGNVVALEALLKKLAGRVDKFRVQTSDDDPPQRPGLSPTNRRPVRFDDEPAVGIGPHGKAFAPETVHRNGHVDVRQKGLQMI